jgi:hypothetical protein
MEVARDKEPLAPPPAAALAGVAATGSSSELAAATEAAEEEDIACKRELWKDEWSAENAALTKRHQQ